jgi:hypothetical protein
MVFPLLFPTLSGLATRSAEGFSEGKEGEEEDATDIGSELRPSLALFDLLEAIILARMRTNPGSSRNNGNLEQRKGPFADQYVVKSPSLAFLCGFA